MTPSSLKLSLAFVLIPGVLAGARPARADVAVVEVPPSAPASLPADAEQAPAQAPTGAERSPGPVTVVLHASEPGATLERQTSVQTYAGLPVRDLSIAGVATWAPECVAPCEAHVDPRRLYRVAGPGLVPSETFSVKGGGPVALDADMGSAPARMGGLALAAGGAGGLLLGGAALVASPILAQDNVGSPALRSGVLVSGIAVTTLSAFVLGAGLWLWARSDTKLRPDPARGFVF